MKFKTALSAKILALAIAFSFPACQRSAAENPNISSLPVNTPPSNASPTATPNSPIRNIDFKNFTYPSTESASDIEESFTLKNGERPFVRGSQTGIFFVRAEYGDVTHDGAEEAFIDLSIQTGGSMIPNMIYVYTLENKKPRLLWSFMTGDRAEGGFKKLYAENGELVIETFGDNKFENDEWKFDLPKEGAGGYCCPTAYTKIRFKWNGRKFVPQGAPELFDYDWKNQQKEESKNSQF